jgi:Mannosyltransferase putative
VLNNILIDAAMQFHPDGKDVKNLDMAHLARQTAVLSDLLRVYERIPTTTRELQEERAAFRHTIEAMQQALYPWITQAKDGKRTYDSFFNLLDSYTEDVGIVISAGKNGGFRWAMHQIIVLRKVLNSTLPIEVFYGGEDDLPKEYQTFIHSLQTEFPHAGPITAVDITQKFPDPDNILGLPGRWAMRPFSLLASSFKTAILTDADTIFLQDPRIILEEPKYKEFGSVFWHDRMLSQFSDDTAHWADELLEAAKAKHMDRVRSAGWFTWRNYYEMER